MKWYDENGSESSVIVASRIRLVRNLKAYKFPDVLSEEEQDELTKVLLQKLKKLSALDGRSYEESKLSTMSECNRGALLERQIISKAAAETPRGSGILLSKDEAVSITLNSVDHIRMQISQSGMELSQIWAQIDKMDDCINEMYPYAFDSKFGYMTAYPTNLGTGMKAYLILHLALLDSTERFAELTNEVGRYGLKIRPALGRSKESSGNLYVLFNQKTLGVSEKEVLQVIEKVASQLASQEQKMRNHLMKKNRLHAEDICCKAYGALKYARLLSLESGMNLLSQLRWGQEEQLITLEKYCNIYELMLAIQPHNLSSYYKKELEGEALEQARAEFLRTRLPNLKM